MAVSADAPARSAVRRRWVSIASLAAIGVAVSYFWYSPVLLPLKLLVVVFHELSHAVAGILTGGSVHAINVSLNQGGYTEVHGGMPLAVLLAGYPGSMACGSVLLLLSQRDRSCRWSLGLLGVILFASLYFVLGSGEIFALAYIAATAVVLILLAWKTPPLVHGIVLQSIAAVTMLYAIPDVLNDVFYQAHRPSDATYLQAMTHVHAYFWGALWIGLSAGVGALTLKRYFAQSPA